MNDQRMSSSESRLDQLERAGDTTAQHAARSKVLIYVLSIVFLSIAGLAFVLGMTMLRPTEDNTMLITTGVTSIGATITALLGLTLREVSVQMDGRLTELLKITQEAALAKGKLAGPDTQPSPPGDSL